MWVTLDARDRSSSYGDGRSLENTWQDVRMNTSVSDHVLLSAACFSAARQFVEELCVFLTQKTDLEKKRKGHTANSPMGQGCSE